MHRSGLGGDIFFLEHVVDLCVLVLSGRSYCRTFAFTNVLVGDGGHGVELEHISSK